MSQKTLRVVNPAVEKASRKDLLALQERRLIAQVQRAYQRVPYYRNRLPPQAGNISSLAEFQDIIPFQSKADFCPAPMTR